MAAFVTKRTSHTFKLFTIFSDSTTKVDVTSVSSNGVIRTQLLRIENPSILDDTPYSLCVVNVFQRVAIHQYHISEFSCLERSYILAGPKSLRCILGPGCARETSTQLDNSAPLDLRFLAESRDKPSWTAYSCCRSRFDPCNTSASSGKLTRFQCVLPHS